MPIVSTLLTTNTFTVRAFNSQRIALTRQFVTLPSLASFAGKTAAKDSGKPYSFFSL